MSEEKVTGTKVTAVDLESGEEEVKVILNDFAVVTDGSCFIDGYQAYKNGTVVITIKKEKQVKSDG